MFDDSIRLVSPVWTRYTPILAERGEGAYIYDEDGTAYLDFTCGIGVTNTGHCHPWVVRAVQEQAAKLLHAQVNIIFHRPLLQLVEELRDVVPYGLDSFFFSNSGAEAIEASVKLARHATQRPNIIVFQGSFHGRTAMTMALTTSKTIYRAGYQPLPAGVVVAPFPYAHRYGWSEEETEAFCLGELELLLRSQTAPSETAAMLIEPVLGEGGYVVPPAGFLAGLRRICDEHGILLIADEVQSGFGRTGEWFGIDNFNVKPDIVVMAKGMASGLPMSGIAARPELMERWTPGSHGGTYGGNAITCAAAVATIQAIREEGMLDNARAMGGRLVAGLRELKSEFSAISDVRGLGLMLGTEFRTTEGKPATKLAKRVVKGCLERRLMLLTCGTWDNTVRWIPPLIVSEQQVDHALGLFGEAIADAVADEAH
jgi:4-aminobutyrate aminotransferase